MSDFADLEPQAAFSHAETASPLSAIHYQASDRGCPTAYSEATASIIISLISQGKSLRSICALPDMPAANTIYDWMDLQSYFAKRYARAREDRADAIFEETLDIADDGRNDWMEKNDPTNPGWLANHEHIQRSRLRVDTRKWFIAKLHPAKYGDHVGPGQASVTVNVVGISAAVSQKLAGLAERIEGPPESV
jgi:hypothetical protein